MNTSSASNREGLAAAWRFSSVSLAALLVLLASTPTSARSEEWTRPAASVPPPPPPPPSSTAVDVATGVAIGGGGVALAGLTLCLGTFLVFGTEDPGAASSAPPPAIADTLLITGGVAAGVGFVTGVTALFVRMGLLMSAPTPAQPALSSAQAVPRLDVDVSPRGARVGLAWSF